MRNLSRSNLGASRGPLKLHEVRIHGTGFDVSTTAPRSTRSTNIPDSYGRKHMGISAILHWNDELLSRGARIGASSGFCRELCAQTILTAVKDLVPSVDRARWPKFSPKASVVTILLPRKYPM